MKYSFKTLRHWESGQPCRVPDFSGKALSFSPFNLMLADGLLYIAFIIFRYDPCIPNFSNTFIIKGCWILSNAFSASNEMIIGFFFQFIYRMDYIDIFSYVEPALHLWDEAYLIIMDYFFDVVLDLVFQYFIEHFCINVHERDWSVNSLSWLILCVVLVSG